MSDIGIRDDLPRSEIRDRSPEDPIVVVWMARNLPRKALPLALEVFAEVDPALPVRFEVLGAGLDDPRVAATADELGIHDRVDFFGHLPWEEAQERLENADVLLFCSLRDTSGVQMAEAMAAGMAVICFDHQGAALLVNESFGVKIPVTTPEDARRRMAGAIGALATDRDRLRKMREAALEASRHEIFSLHVSAVVERLASVARR
jgi:glycosyltransferase involved in cell wall biosynthesis